MLLRGPCITDTGCAATAEVLQHLCVAIAPFLQASLQLTDVMISPLLYTWLNTLFPSVLLESMIYDL